MAASSSSTYSLGDEDECPLCCEPYDQGLRRKIPCSKCGAAICQADLLQFMELNFLMPQCPIKTCAQEFDEAYLFKILPAKEAPAIRRYFRRILLEQAKSRFGPILTRIQEHGSVHDRPRKKLNPEVKALKAKYFEAHAQVEKYMAIKAWLWSCLMKREARDAGGHHINEAHRLKVHYTQLQEAVRRTELKLDSLQLIHQEAKMAYNHCNTYMWVDRHGNKVDRPQAVHAAPVASSSSEPAPSKKSFIFPCGQGDCTGYLSTRWKCMICDKWRCNSCHEPKVGDDHKCDPNNVESAKFRMSQTSPCPKCGVPIEKAGGCNHMFCVSCNVGFDWKTGREISLQHNSNHLAYQYRQRMGLGTPGEGPPPPCGGEIEAINTLILARRMFAFGMSSRDVAKAWDFRNLVDPNNGYMRPSNDNINLEDYSERFLLGLVTEKQLSNQAFKVYRKNNRTNHHNGIKLTLQTAGIDILNAIIMSKNAEEVRKHLRSINTLVDYINEAFYQINADLLYQNRPFIDEVFGFHNSLSLRLKKTRTEKVSHTFVRIKDDVIIQGIDQITDPEEQLAYIRTAPAYVAPLPPFPRFGVPYVAPVPIEPLTVESDQDYNDMDYKVESGLDDMFELTE